MEYAKCTRSLDALFVLDQSGSVSVDNWRKEIEFAAQLSEGLTRIYHDPQFGIIVFGPSPPPIPRPLSNMTGIQNQLRELPGCQQFLNPRNRTARTCTTPTDQAIAAARTQFALHGRNDTSRVLFLVTDGRPETGIINADVSKSLANETVIEAMLAKREGISIITVGITLDASTQQLMNQIASNPAEDYSYPDVNSFDELVTRLPSILATTCFYISDVTPNVGCAGDTIAVSGDNFFATDDFLRCRFTFADGERFFTRGQHFNHTLMYCVVPPKPLESSSFALVEVTTDGQGYTDNGFTFQYRRNCGERDDNITALGVVTGAERGIATWWPWLFFLLLPLLCCLLLCLWCLRRRKDKEQIVQAQAVPQNTLPEEETFQIEGLETNSVSPNSPKKWKVQPSAYIGFGKGKMDVNWNGEAPESAPHAQKRQLADTEDPAEGIPLTPVALAHVGDRRQKKRGCCPWLCWASQETPQYPQNEGEGEGLAAVPRVVFHADTGDVGLQTREVKSDVEG